MMITIDDLVSEYQEAVRNREWSKDFSELVDEVEGNEYGNKLNLKNQFLRKNEQSLGVTEIDKVITQVPSILSYQVEINLKPSGEYLGSLGMKNVGAVVTKFPTILAMDVENNLKPTMEYLVNECNVSIEKIESSPSLVSYSLNERIKPRHAFLQSRQIHVGCDVQIRGMLAPKDRIFAERVAKSDYGTWMSFKREYLKKVNSPNHLNTKTN